MDADIISREREALVKISAAQFGHKENKMKMKHPWRCQAARDAELNGGRKFWGRTGIQDSIDSTESLRIL